MKIESRAVGVPDNLKLDTKMDKTPLQKQKWYFAKIGRSAAEEYLTHHMNLGTFLIRDSDSTAGTYSLSVVKADAAEGCKISHMKIHCVDDKSYWIRPSRCFPSLEALVECYKSSSNDIDVQLVVPCPKDDDQSEDTDEDNDSDANGEVADLTQDSEEESEAQTESDSDSGDGIRGSGSPTFYIINHVDEPDTEWKPYSVVDESEPVLVSNKLTVNSAERPKYVNVKLRNSTATNGLPTETSVVSSPSRAAAVKMESTVDKDQSNSHQDDDSTVPMAANDFTGTVIAEIKQDDENEVQITTNGLTDPAENDIENTQGSPSEHGSNNEESQTLPKTVEGEQLTLPLTSHVTRSQPISDPSAGKERPQIQPPTTAISFAKRMAKRFAAEVQNQPWYFGKLGREKSVSLLSSCGSHGMYLVRDSDSTADRYTLSAYHGDKSDYRVAHYKIEMTAGFCHLGSSALQFANICGLITYYTNHQLSPKFKLTIPCPKETLRQSTDAAKELDQSSIALDRQIHFGNGTVNELWQGVWEGVMDVSVTIVRKNNRVLGKNWRGHVDMLNNLQHRNIVSFYGIAVNDAHDKVYVVSEWMEKGSLLNCLQQSLFSNFLEKVCIAEQISSAMLYLQARKVVLRNLQAQNVAVTKHSECKLFNFETAEFLTGGEYKSTEELTNIPAKWTAPEAAFFGKFSTSSDVWSYGVVLYEIFSDGKAPYSDMASLECLFQIKEGHRIPHPTESDCPMSAYELMLQCWQEKPEDRPTFRDLREKLKSFYTTTRVDLVVLKHTFALLS